jgi:hypothetical protein
MTVGLGGPNWVSFETVDTLSKGVGPGLGGGVSLQGTITTANDASRLNGRSHVLGGFVPAGGLSGVLGDGYVGLSGGIGPSAGGGIFIDDEYQSNWFEPNPVWEVAPGGRAGDGRQWLNNGP